jgi:hypothetical protein
MHRTASLIFAASVFWTSAIAVAQVQPGSTGGTVGKQDKSVSGGDTPQESRPSTRKQEPHPSVAKNSSCGRIAGTWQWGGYTVVVKQDGSAHNSYGNVDGTWTCKDRQFSSSTTRAPSHLPSQCDIMIVGEPEIEACQAGNHVGSGTV